MNDATTALEVLRARGARWRPAVTALLLSAALPAAWLLLALLHASGRFDYGSSEYVAGLARPPLESIRRFLVDLGRDFETGLVVAVAVAAADDFLLAAMPVVGADEVVELGLDGGGEGRHFKLQIANIKLQI